MIHYDIENKTQKIVYLETEDHLISCMAVNLSNNLIAIGTKRHPQKGNAFVSIFEINSGKSRKKYENEDGAKEIISVSFSADGKYIFGQGSAPGR